MRTHVAHWIWSSVTTVSGEDENLTGVSSEDEKLMKSKLFAILFLLLERFNMGCEIRSNTSEKMWGGALESAGSSAGTDRARAFELTPGYYWQDASVWIAVCLF